MSAKRAASPHHPRALRADEDGGASRSGAARRNLAITGLVIPSLEIDTAFSKQRSNDLQSLFEAANPVIVGIPERMVLGLVPAGTDTEYQTPVTHFIQGNCHLGEQRRVSKAVASDKRTELDTRGRRRQSAEHGPRLPGAAGLSRGHFHLDGVVGRRLAKQQVIGNEQRVEPNRFGRQRHVTQVRPSWGPAALRARHRPPAASVPASS